MINCTRKPSAEITISGNKYIRADMINEITVYLLCQWGNCCDGECYCEGNMVVEICATEQLAKQLLAKRGGHSYGYVTKKNVITKLKEAGY